MSQHLLPVIRSEEELKIPWKNLRSIIGGESIIEIDDIHTTSLESAGRFLREYGVDPLTADGRTSTARIRSLEIEYLHIVNLKENEEAEFDKDKPTFTGKSRFLVVIVQTGSVYERQSVILNSKLISCW